MQTDAEIVARILAGQADAFATLVARYERLVRGTLLARVRDRHAAEDLAQETFMAAYRSLHSLRQADSFGGWLLEIARRQAAHHLRRGSPIERLGEYDPAEGDVASSITESSCDLLAMVEKLPAHERLVVGLVHFGGHSAQKASAMTGRPVGTVTKQLSRAYARLKKWVETEVRL